MCIFTHNMHENIEIIRYLLQVKKSRGAGDCCQRKLEMSHFLAKLNAKLYEGAPLLLLSLNWYKNIKFRTFTVVTGPYGFNLCHFKESFQLSKNLLAHVSDLYSHS